MSSNKGSHFINYRNSNGQLIFNVNLLSCCASNRASVHITLYRPCIKILIGGGSPFSLTLGGGVIGYNWSSPVKTGQKGKQITVSN